MNKCNNYNCKTGCVEIISGKCVYYTGNYLSTLDISTNTDFNTVLSKINLYLSVNGGGGGLTQVYTEDSPTVTWTGTGTQLNPLIATVVGGGGGNLQQVTDLGHTTTNNIEIFSETAESSEYRVSNLPSNSVLALQTFEDEISGEGTSAILMQGFDRNMFILSNNPLEFMTDFNSPIITVNPDGTVQGTPGTAPDHFATVSQLPETIEGLQKVGTTYNKTSWTNLADFSVNTAGATIVANKINIPNGGVTDFTKSLQLVPYSCVNHWKIEIEFQLTVPISGTTTGISIGIQSTNTNSACSIATYFSASTTNTGRMELFAQANSNNPTANWTSRGNASSNLTFTQGDNIRFSMERINNNLYMKAENLSQAVAAVYYNEVMPLDNIFIIPPNTGHFAIFSQGGTYTINKWTVWNNEIKNPDVMMVGDSKTLGYGANSFYNTYPGIVGSKYANIAISAGFGDTTQQLLNHLPEILTIAPKQVVLMIGSNDIRFGVPNATFQANYTSIVNQLTTAGIEVIHLSPTYETAQDNSGQDIWVKATFTPVVDIYRLTALPGGLYTDNIHWSIITDTEVASRLVNSNLLKGVKTDQEFDLPIPYIPGPTDYVQNQATSPGTVQTGNLNLSGTVRATLGRFQNTTFPQLQVYYSDTVGMNINVPSTGLVTFQTVGSGSRFSFNSRVDMIAGFATNSGATNSSNIQVPTTITLATDSRFIVGTGTGTGFRAAFSGLSTDVSSLNSDITNVIIAKHEVRTQAVSTNPTMSSLLVMPPTLVTGQAPILGSTVIIESPTTTAVENHSLTVLTGSSKFGGGILLPIRTVTATTTMTAADHTLIVNNGAVDVTITLPAHRAGSIFVVKRLSTTNNVTIVPPTGQIDGAANYIITSANVAITVQSNGTNYYII